MFNSDRLGDTGREQRNSLDQMAQESAAQSSVFHMAVRGRGMSFTESRHSLWELSDHNAASRQ